MHLVSTIIQNHMTARNFLPRVIMIFGGIIFLKFTMFVKHKEFLLGEYYSCLPYFQAFQMPVFSQIVCFSRRNGNPEKSSATAVISPQHSKIRM